MPFVSSRIDDMAFHVPWTAEGRSRQPGGGAAPEADSERDLAAHPSFHLQSREGILMRREVVGPFAFVVPGGRVGFGRLDLEPEVDRHRHAVKARTDVGDRGGCHELAYPCRHLRAW